MMMSFTVSGCILYILFTIYVNDIISRLEDSRYGCRVDGRYVGIVAKPLSKPDDKVGRCEWERVGCV